MYLCIYIYRYVHMKFSVWFVYEFGCLCFSFLCGFAVLGVIACVRGCFGAGMGAGGAEEGQAAGWEAGGELRAAEDRHGQTPAFGVRRIKQIRNDALRGRGQPTYCYIIVSSESETTNATTICRAKSMVVRGRTAEQNMSLIKHARISMIRTCSCFKGPLDEDPPCNGAPTRTTQNPQDINVLILGCRSVGAGKLGASCEPGRSIPKAPCRFLAHSWGLQG